MSEASTYPIGERIRRRRLALGKSQQALAIETGMKQQGIVSIESGAVARPRKLPELADALGTTVRWLLTGEGEEVAEPTIEETQVTSASVVGRTAVPVMGFVGAGAIVEPEFEQVPPEGLDTIELPFAVPDEIIALRVRGDSMLPAYRDGDAVLVWREQRLATESYVGEEAAVRTGDGRRFLKELQYGKRRNTFDLHSHNARLISGVKVEWVGEIYLIVRASQIRRAARAQTATRGRRRSIRERETTGTGELPLLPTQ